MYTHSCDTCWYSLIRRWSSNMVCVVRQRMMIRLCCTAPAVQNWKWNKKNKQKKYFTEQTLGPVVLAYLEYIISFQQQMDYVYQHTWIKTEIEKLKGQLACLQIQPVLLSTNKTNKVIFHIYVFIHVLLGLLLCVCALRLACVCARLCVCALVCVCAHTCAYVCVFMSFFLWCVRQTKNTHIYTRVYAHTHKRTHTRKPECVHTQK